MTSSTRPAADLIVTNGRIYTMEPAQPWAEAVAISGKTISFVGDAAGAEAFAGPHTRRIDLNQRLALPGLVESHLHLLLGAATMSGAILGMEDTLEDVLAKVAAYAAAHPDRETIFGASYNALLFDERGPAKELLDHIVPDRPVVLLDHTLHSAWANSAAFRQAGITADTPDPLPGFYVRDDKGEPTGSIKGGPASLPVIRAVQAITAASIMASIPAVTAGLSAFGFTTALECGNPLFTEAALEALLSLDHEGKLPLRLSLTVMANNAETASALIADSRRYADTYASEHLWFDLVKIVGDSVLENQTAALLEPYLSTGDCGYLYFEPEQLDRLVAAASAAGFGIVYHAIGDRTARTGLDAAAALRARGDRHTRFIITHLQLVNRADRGRFAELDVHVQTTGNWANYQPPYVELLGLERLDRDQFPFRDYVASGANVCFGADWPATPGGFELGVNPFINIYTAMHRKVPTQYLAEFASEDRVLGPPDQTLTLAEAIAAYTINGARALGRADQFGSLAVGKLADLVVLNQDLFAIDPIDIPATTVLLTLMEGRIVHQRPDATL